MDHQLFQLLTTVAGLLIAAIGFCITWWVNNIWAKVQIQERELAELRVKLAEGYMPRPETQAALERIFALLEEIRREVRHA